MLAYLYNRYSQLISYRKLIFSIKLLVGALLLWLIYREVFVNHNVIQLQETLVTAITISNVPYLIAVFLLMPINWSLEAIKWQRLIAFFHPSHFWEALWTIFAGLSFGVITPSRIGEYGGRFYMMQKSSRWKSVSATFVGSMAQNIITAITGMGGAAYLIYTNQEWNKYLASSIFYVAGIALIIGLVIYFKIGLFQNLVQFLPHSRLSEKLTKHSLYLQKVNHITLQKVIILSFLRYIIYTCQYLLLLHFFGINVPIIEAVAVVAVIFLVQSGLPLPPLLGMIARGEIALIFWAYYTENTLGILATTFSLWSINLIIPALIGTGMIVKK